MTAPLLLGRAHMPWSLAAIVTRRSHVAPESPERAESASHSVHVEGDAHAN